MAESAKCRECGASVQDDAPRGLCPRCLLNVVSDPNATGTFRPAAKPTGPKRAAASVDRAGFLRGVRELKLVPEPELEQLDKATPGDADALAAALVQVKRLTPYQAAALVQGKGRGLLIGSYLVLDRLGRGGMGMVFKALHRTSGQKVALKILPPSFARDVDAVKRFQREFQVASRLSHPNLIQAIEASEDRGVHYLTMEYIPGYDLDRLVSQGGPMELRLALHCVIQVARGLEEAHEQGVIHRDIKPGNVMIDPAGAVRVLDLGLARVTRANDHFGQTAAGSLTQTGAYMGTVDFLAPEQADDAKSADARSDIYSLGCTLYFLLTGRAPFAGDSVLKRLMAHQSTPPPSLREARPDVPEQLDRIYLRMMAKRPGGRPQTMSELILDLEACRANPREAGDVSVDLKTFARTALKRAPDRKNRGPDDSVFARPGSGEHGLVFDPNLSLEDLVAGYREERGHEQLPEDKLPPIARQALPPRPKRRRSHSGTNGVVAFFAVGLAIAGYTMWPKAAPKEDVPVVEKSQASPIVPIAQAKAEPKKAEAEKEPPFRSLFNGKDLSGWEVHPSQPSGWKVENGLLIGSGAEHGYLYTSEEFGDVHIRAEVRINEGGNSGIVARSSFGPKTPAKDPVYARGYEVQIDSTKRPTYHATTGSLYDPTGGVVVKKEELLVKPGEWATVELLIEGNHVDTRVNGKGTAHYIDNKNGPGRGRIALQLYLKDTVVEFRKIEVQTPFKFAKKPDESVAAGGAPKGTPWSRELSDPSSGMPDISEADRGKPRPFNGEVGYDRGVWHYNATGGSVFSVPIPYPRGIDEAEIVIPARVVGDAVRSKGSVKIHILNRTDPRDPKTERGLQMRIDGLGQFFLEPSFWTAKMAPNGPWKGPISHPAIQRGGGAFNVWTIRLRQNSIQVLINGAEVLTPTVFAYNLTPSILHLGVQSEDGIVRAEYDRIEIREYADGPPAPGSIADPSLGKIIAAQDFGAASGPLMSGVFPMGKGNPPNSSGNEAGVYFQLHQGSWKGAGHVSGLHPRLLNRPFQIEVTGRVLGGTPETVGAWAFVVDNPATKRGVAVGIGRDGKLWVNRPWWTPKETPDDYRFTPYSGPDLRPPDRFNTVALRVENRRVRLLLNRKPIGEPIDLGYDIFPANCCLQLIKPDLGTTVRTEYDRVEIREWNP